MIGLFNKTYKFLIIFALILMQEWIVQAQVLKINAKFDSTTILIGDQVKLHIEVDQPKDAKVKFPVFSDTLTSKIKVIKTFPIDTIRKDGNLHLRQDLLVTSFDSGYHYISPLVFPFEMGTIKDTIRSTQLYLSVFTIPMGNAKEIRDVKPPYQAPFTLAEIWLFILIGAGVLILGFAIWFFVKKYRKEPIFGLKKPTEPPHVIALRDLDKLRAEKLWQQNKIKQYYTRLTEIIRVYIEQRFGIKAMEQTSDEILQSFKGVYIEDITVLDLLSKIFTIADLVKFAKSLPLPDENEISLLNAYQFVNNTKITVIPQVDQTGAQILTDTESDNESKQPQVGTQILTDTGHVKESKHPQISTPIQEKVERTAMLNIIFLIKRLRLTYRIGILLGVFSVLSFQSIPDFIFNIKQKQPQVLTITDLSRMSDNEIPRYLEVKDAVVPGDAYIEITKKQYGIETLDHILYPVYSIGDIMNKNKASILVKDYHAKKDELNKGTYFKSILFKIGGKFEGDRITSQDLKLLEDHGIKIDSNAIVIIKDSVALSLGLSLLISIICLILIILIAFSFVPKRTLEGIIGKRSNNRLNN